LIAIMLRNSTAKAPKAFFLHGKITTHAQEMNKGNTDLQAVVFKNTQTLLRKYLVKLKQFLVPADKKQGIPGPCAQPEQKQAIEQRHFAAAWNFSGRTLYCC